MNSDYALAYYGPRPSRNSRHEGQHDTGDDTALDLGDLADLIQQEVGQILEQDVTVEIERDGNRVRGQDTPSGSRPSKGEGTQPGCREVIPFRYLNV